MSTRRTAPAVYAMKSAGERIVCLTAYDLFGAQVAEAAGVDVVLVGDSLGSVVMGRPTTLSVTMPIMEHHMACVAAGCRSPLLVADMPFGSYGGEKGATYVNAVRLMQAGAQAVKLEGAYVEEIEMLVRAGIPVMGHVGFTPQSIHAFGGHRVQGKGDDGERVLLAAQQVADAGAFAVVLELIPPDLASLITTTVHAPTIGIGAGPECDGQIQVFHDVLGLTANHFKHADRRLEGLELSVQAVAGYGQAVRQKTFKRD
jgi:3-methyl-2-oxobutanoate hydroxymethyltransferase